VVKAFVTPNRPAALEHQIYLPGRASLDVMKHLTEFMRFKQPED
jgi:hypothetical protein